MSDLGVWTFRTMIVPAAYAPLARSLAAGIAGESGAGMWQSPLSATGDAPATHYLSTGQIRESFAAMLTDADAIYAACQAMGAPVTLQQITGMVNASDISEESWQEACARLNLQQVRAAA